MAKKILYCATVDYHFKAFHLPYMKWFKERGWIVDVAASGSIDLPYTDNKFTIPIERSPFRRANLQAYRKLKELITENNYSIIHCHTPLGGVLARYAARRARRNETKVIYTAHGFHFCKGAPKVNWLIYYPIERILARYTDHLITINQEDFDLATKHRFKVDTIEQIAGVGIDTTQYQPVSKEIKNGIRQSFGFSSDDFLLFNVGEFNKNKNQQYLLHVMAEVVKYVPNVRLLLAGEGELLAECKALAQKLRISHIVHFLGFRKDIDQLLRMSDIVLGVSFREGLPVNIMEAMACGIPIITEMNRGYKELVHNNVNGFILQERDPIKFAEKIQLLATRKELRNELGANGRQIIASKYSTEQTVKQMGEIYKSHMQDQEEETWAVP